MNKSNLKSYAPQARKDFIAAITGRAHQLGLEEHGGKLVVAPADTQGNITVIAGQAWPAKVNDQRKRLIERIQKDGFAQTMEAVAYTWFNRFAALRYMELHDFLNHGYRALSSASKNPGALPDLLTHATDIVQTSSLPGLNAAEVMELKLAGNRDGELYRKLLVAQCNALSNAMPFLFERIDDETELLLPDNLLRTDSIIAKLVDAIPEEDWQEIEVIGWLYQFYISEKKDQVIGKVVKSEDIPAATQLFTPNWIVQYLVQNSVGRLWLMANPSSTLASEWPYYIQPAEQTPQVQAELDALIQVRMDEDGGTLNPETITVLDPACGSGHILVVAYDVLKTIYLERGYRLRDIPRLILEKNLYGLDIDDRAAQMAGFALLMKARADDRRLFTITDENGQPIPPKLNVLSLKESKGLDAQALYADLAAFIDSASTASDSGFAKNELFPETPVQMSLGEAAAPRNTSNSVLSQREIAELISTFEHAKTFGSLIQINPQRLPVLRKQLSILSETALKADWVGKAAANDLLPLVQQALVLGMQFDAVVANPPYMGSNGMNAHLKDFGKKYLPKGKSDLYAMFMTRGFESLCHTGVLAFVTMKNWMFLKSFSDMREDVLTCHSIQSLVQVGFNSFPEMNSKIAQACAFVVSGYFISDVRGCFIDLNGAEQSADKGEVFLSKEVRHYYERKCSSFDAIPGKPLAFWVSENFRNIFTSNPQFSEIAPTKIGMRTGDNERFLRYWFEVSNLNIFKSAENSEEFEKSNKKWAPYNKGGDFKKWYGNQEHVVNWKNDGSEIKENTLINYPQLSPDNLGWKISNEKYYFSSAITWSDVTSARNAFRFIQNGFIFDGRGSSAFPLNKEYLKPLLGYLNSEVVYQILAMVNPSLTINVGDVGALPVPLSAIQNSANGEIVSRAIELSKLDWDSFEQSWNFSEFSIFHFDNSLLSRSWESAEKRAAEAISEMQKIERQNNKHFIDALCLQTELSPEVPEDQITLTRADREKDCQRLISYAIGCMMGRYSLDDPGLIYAHEGNIDFDASRYKTFPADGDGILPVTDEHWFADDAPERVREFLQAVWGPDTLEENMAWLAESLGTKGSETPAETIRRYIADKFYKDHLQTYKKRPIYWLFSSGKQGAFQALVYLHRYNESTLARMRAEYVVPLTGKMQARIDMLQKDASAASSTAARNKINKEIEKLTKKHAELLAYDEKLRHYADMRIKLDLDDGVKVNYGKFGDLLDSVKIITGGSSDD
ncbi:MULTISPECIES: BREX-1 system adenine-specific DNA-methyltransferase PglX [Comamonas]|uniref:BREX-1 system adenine-specific DNA-methyltransferase PglX n=1 Tax=Comamonas TaxID=283 RepID=UPI0006B9B61D|nr:MULTISPECIES: BREX-1 system adenine-specific DNA-methyltransferase PglX [Comamonas]QOQ80604.1 BREX-1 system adenine-specific DNA-methyltransferase PglX [Comamonas thiooxydans]